MTDYSVTLTLTTEPHLDDDVASDVARAGCIEAGLDLAMTSTSRDDPWLRITAVTQAAPEGTPATSLNGAPDVVSNVVAAFGDELRHRGVTITSWETLEVVSVDEQLRRGRNRAIPPMVNAAELAELAGLTVQRIYQLESERSSGKRADFPAPVLDGYWLRTVGEHWAATRKTKPGPAPAKPMTVDEALSAATHAANRIAQERRNR